MNLRALFGRADKAPPGPRCGRCRHFDNDPHRIEAAMPGLAALSSAAASVRSDDGLCTRHGRYLRARYACGDFDPP